MSAMASKITSLTIVYSTVYSDGDQRKHQSSASLAFVRGIHRWPVNSPHKGPVTRKMFPFDDVSMVIKNIDGCHMAILVSDEADITKNKARSTPVKRRLSRLTNNYVLGISYMSPIRICQNRNPRSTIKIRKRKKHEFMKTKVTTGLEL